MNKEDKLELYKLLEKKEALRKQNIALFWFNCFYDWQIEFCASTRDYFESCLMAANQIGKTLVGTVIDAFHLMGNYPDNWPGHKFKHAPLIWCLGVSTEKTRDLLQTALFGKYDKLKGFEGGLVPKDKILDKESVSGVMNAMRTVRVKHASGGISTVQFWSYAQGQDVLMGDKVDHAHIDEDPKDQKIRPQVITRTLNGDKGKGGKIIYTFTPEHGLTDTVMQFRDNLTASQFFMRKGWSDSPHMTPEKRERALLQYPEHQRDMRSTGVPMRGHGRIYDVSDDFVLCEPFPIPDHWKTIIAIDFGDDHPQGIVRLSHDPENDAVYVTNSWRARQVSANDAWGATHKWSAGFPVAWPIDGLNGEKARDDSLEIKEHYVDAGFNMLPDFATWPEKVNSRGKLITGGVGVESGVYAILDRARKGNFKMFTGQSELMDEWREYHRDENGNIVKIRDDLLCAVRYGIMSLRFAVYNKQIKSSRIVLNSEPIGIIGIGSR